jgi:hypothetical protein
VRQVLHGRPEIINALGAEMNAGEALEEEEINRKAEN